MKIQIINRPKLNPIVRLVDGENYIDFTMVEAMDLSIGLRDALISIDKKLNGGANDDSDN